MIKETTERQSFERASQILSGKDDTEFLDSENSAMTLDPKDIYMRVASNLELIQLYTTVNQQLVETNPRNCSALFRRTTTSLVGIREALDQIEVQISFKHEWFPKSKRLSYWEFFNRFNLETEKKEQAINVKKFFLRY
jgi:flagellin-specific chaperone FliS